MTTQGPFRYSHTIGFYGVGQGRGFNVPVDVALGRDERLYVINRGGNESDQEMARKSVTVCSVEEDYIGTFGIGGSDDGQLMWPVSIATDRDDNVYISDEALHRISIFDRDGHFVTKWGVQGSGNGQFDRPAGIAFDSNDNLLVADGLNHRVQRYTKDGEYLGGWGWLGRGDGELYMPWGIAVDRSDNVYVADWRNDRIHKFDPEGKHLATWGSWGQGDGQFRRPSGVAVDGEGYIYVADWGNERVQVLGPDGGFLAKLRGESGVSKWGQDYFISNQDELEERQKADMEPELDLPPDAEYFREESASVEKLIWGPTSVKVDSKGRLFIVESCRYRIQVYVKSGQPSQ